MYAKILVGENKGKTLFVATKYKDGLILVKFQGKEFDYIPEEYIEVDMFGRNNK